MELPVYGADVRRSAASNKISGKVAYAVHIFWRVPWYGRGLYPMPWANLKYDARLGGYRVGITQQLRSSIETPTGIGLTVQGTALYTTITRLRFGTDATCVMGLARGSTQSAPIGS